MKTLLFILSLGLMASVVSADPPEPPEFVNCPDHYFHFSPCDSIYYQFEAINPNHPEKCNDDGDEHHGNHCSQIRYRLISGPGEVNAKTGEWYWNPSIDDITFNSYVVTVSAEIGNSGNETDEDHYCRLIFFVRDHNPRIYIDDKGTLSVFNVSPGSSYEYELSTTDQDGCEIDSVLIDSVVPNIPGVFSIEDQKLIVNIPDNGHILRYYLYLTTELYQDKLSSPFIFDPRENPAPMFVECPLSFETSACTYLRKHVTAVDPDNLPDYNGRLIQYEIVEGPGVMGRNQDWRYTPQEADFGQTFDVVIAASYGDIWSQDSCSFSFTVRESPLGIFMDNYECGDTLDVNFGDFVNISMTSVNAFCDYNAIAIVNVSEDVEGEMWVSNEGVIQSYFYYEPAYNDGGKNIEVTFGAKDGRDSVFCSVVLKTAWNTQNAPYKVSIDTIIDAVQGTEVSVSINLDSGSVGIHGFDLMMVYEPSAITFNHAEPGQFLTECGWEYFSYRFGSFEELNLNRQLGFIRIISIAETNNGSNHPSCYQPIQYPDELAELYFVISNDHDYACTRQPVRFYWFDCDDNVFAEAPYENSNTLFVSDKIFDTNGPVYFDISDSTIGYPTYQGNQGSCSEQTLPFINFYNGYVDIACADSVDRFPIGDINLNRLAYDIGDIVLFSNYLIFGESVFIYNLEKQLENTDINTDSLFGTIEDYILMKNIITGGSISDSSFFPLEDTLLIQIGNNEIKLANSVDLGGIFMIVEGENNPVLNLPALTIHYNFLPSNNSTRILLTANEQGAFYGAFDYLLSNVSGNINHIGAATFDGRRVPIKLDFVTDVDDDNSDLPTTYALSQNYPNPFNNATVIHFDLPKSNQVRFEIYNILGETVYSIERDYSAGSHTIYWDGKNSSGTTVASGLYYYRIETDDFTQSKKMILLK